MVRRLSGVERWIRTFSTAARRPGISEASGRLRALADEVCVTLRWREMDSNPRSPVKKNPLVATVLFGLPAFPFRERPRVRKPSPPAVQPRQPSSAARACAGNSRSILLFERRHAEYLR